MVLAAMQMVMISALKSQGPTISMCLSQDYSYFSYCLVGNFTKFLDVQSSAEAPC